MDDRAPDAMDELSVLLRLSASLVTGGPEDWGQSLREATDSAGPVAVEEVVLQSYLFVGFPVVLNVLALLREISPTPESVPDGSLDERREAGEHLCGRVYGPAYERLRAHVTALHPDLDRWMVEEGYGKTLSRPGLDAVERELCVVSLLAAAGHIPQLRSHLRGSLNVGATPAQVAAAVEIGLDTARDQVRRRPGEVEVLGVWEEVLSRVSDA